MSSRLRRPLLLALLVLLLRPGMAQQTLGSITGLVTDPGGAILPGTTVTASGRCNRAEAGADRRQQRRLCLPGPAHRLL